MPRRNDALVQVVPVVWGEGKRGGLMACDYCETIIAFREPGSWLFTELPDAEMITYGDAKPIKVLEPDDLLNIYATIYIQRPFKEMMLEIELPDKNIYITNAAKINYCPMCGEKLERQVEHK